MTLLALFPNMLVVNPAFPPNSVGDLIAAARAQLVRAAGIKLD